MTDNHQYKYINFRLIETKPKTTVWSCRNNNSEIELGVIKWHPSWRQYCYFPTVQAVYSKGCLIDISDFIDKLMNERKKSND